MKKIFFASLIFCLLLAGCSENKDDRYLYDENGLVTGVNDEVLDHTGGDSVTWSYDEETKTLTFEGEGAIVKRENYEPYSLYAEKIEIGDGVVSIGASAFENFGMLKEITIPESIRVIDNRAFYNCSSLEDIYLPQALEFLGSEAFVNCMSLASVEIPKNDMLFEIKGGVFADCGMLEMVIIPPTISYIEPDVFSGSRLVSIYCEKDSFAYDYAMTEGIQAQTYNFN